MRRISISSLALGFLFLLNLFHPDYIFGQKPLTAPVDLEVPMAPSPVKADGKIHLFYELHITNFRAKTLELTRIEVLNDEANAQPLASYKETELINRLGRPGAPPDLSDKRIIGGGMRAIVFLQITVNTETDIPRSLHHRLFFKPDEPGASGVERVVDGALVVVRRSPPLVIAPPLRGERWLAANGLSNKSEHRRAVVPVDGKARIAQRFAADWIKLGTDGQAFHGNPASNANWYAYGTEVLAVAKAVVVAVHDGIPENDPTSDKKAVPITLETVGGNYIILDLGNGYFAFYAHLQPKSLRVKVGDKVSRGQALALLGNSGNSDAPHLHFHISDANSPLGAEGVPFVFESFDVQGAVKSLEVLEGGEGWKPQPNAAPDKRQMEIPIENAVVRFP
jgi:murein DD-endopeptidase